MITVGLALFAAACAPPTVQPESQSTATDDRENGFEQLYSQLAGLDGDARTAKLIEIGNIEGHLSIYTSNTQMQQLVDEFEDIYQAQGLTADVSIYRAPDNTLLQRILVENDADYAGADLYIEGQAPQMAALSEETDILARFESPILDKRRDGLDYDLWSITRFTAQSVAWNSDSITGDDVPTSYADLIDPKYKGKIMIEPRAFDWFMTLWQYFEEQGQSESQIQHYFDALADNSRPVEGYPLQTQFLTTGEIPLAVGAYTQLAFKAAQTGAPVAYEPFVEPIVLSPAGAGLIKRSSSPALAVLFMEYILTKGQDLLSEMGRIPPKDLEDTGLLAGADYVVTEPTQVVGDEAEKWRARYDALMEGRDVITE